MTDTRTPVYEITPEVVQHYGKRPFMLCSRYAHETIRCGGDLDLHVYDAVVAAMQGRPLGAVLDCIDDEHPAAAEVKIELHAMVGRMRGWGDKLPLNA